MYIFLRSLNELRRPNEKALIYLISTSTVLSATDHAMKALNVGSSETVCLDFASSSDIMTELKDFAQSRHSGVIAVISGLESLPVDQRSKLNFLHGSTDSNTPFSNIAIFLTWDTQKHPVPMDMPHSAYFEEFMAQGININAAALTGRIKLINLSADSDQITDMSRICPSVAPPSTQPQDITLYFILLLLLIIVLFILWPRRKTVTTSPDNGCSETAGGDKQVQDESSVCKEGEGVGRHGDSNSHEEEDGEQEDHRDNDIVPITPRR